MTKLKFVTFFIDNRGAVRFRFRRTGQPTHYFQSLWGSQEFDEEYQACLAGRRIDKRKPFKIVKPDEFVPVGSTAKAREMARSLAAQYDASTFVYFIGDDKGPIKIGTSNAPHRRLKDIQMGNPSLLRVLALIPGDKEVEASIQQRFAHHRLSGEWFARHPELLEEIEIANDRGTTLGSH